MRSMAKVIGKIRPDYRGDFRELLGWAAEFVEDVERGEHYIFRDGSRWLFNAPPTDAENNSLVNISLDTLVKLRQIEAEHEQLVFLVKQNWGDDLVKLAQELAE